jgi:hypothetical protein
MQRTISISARFGIVVKQCKRLRSLKTDYKREQYAVYLIDK